VKHDFNELRLDRVTRRFAGAGGRAFNALSELTLNVRRGEFIALLGPSGCGKSTALNCIAGLLPLSGGTIQLDEIRIDTLPPERRGFGMVFQNYALFPHMSVAKNIGFGLRMRGMPQSAIRPRVANALKLVQLTGQEHKLPGQLSGGQQQRVAIARAIVIEPPLILMDEPLSISTRSCGSRRARKSVAFIASSAARPFMSRTTRTKRCRSPIASS
jgi:putative spermidine/putrescine transport system ATP-binding protein